MKQLSLNEMEVVNGGISCCEVDTVLQYLIENNYAQFLAIMEGPGSIMCYTGGGNYVNYFG